MKSDDYYKHCIASVLRVNPREISFNGAPDFIQEGTKSIIKEVICSKNPLHRQDRWYIFKKYREDAIDISQRDQEISDIEEEFIREKVSLHVLNDLQKKDYIPEILSYGSQKFDKEKAILMETIPAMTLEEAITNIDAEARWDSIISSLNVVGKIFDNLPKYQEDLDMKLFEESKGNVTLKERSPQDYKRSGDIYLKGLEPYNSSRFKEFGRSLEDLSRHFFDDEKLKRVGPSDLYPSNITLTSLIDFGTIGEVSIPLMLGCLIGHPSVFGKLKVSSKREGSDEKEERVKYFINYLSKQCFKKFDASKVDTGFYIGAIFGNLRVAAGMARRDPSKIEEIKVFTETAMEQYEILKRRLSHLR